MPFIVFFFYNNQSPPCFMHIAMTIPEHPELDTDCNFHALLARTQTIIWITTHSLSLSIIPVHLTPTS